MEPTAQSEYMIRLGSGEQFGPATIDAVVQWAREGRVPMDALLIPTNGEPAKSVLSDPRLQAELGSRFAAPPTAKDEAPLSGLIPYKNPPALVGYYLGILSWLPFLGAVLGPTAIVLGIIGMRRRLADPNLRGLAHAWIAIIMGLIGTLISAGCILPMILHATTGGRF